MGLQGSHRHRSWVMMSVHQSKDAGHLKRLIDLTRRQTLGILKSHTPTIHNDFTPEMKIARSDAH